ncbi:maestro heat-like repeat-containing protein family member 6 [Crotalus tigris]|uniref:maestro heat-like repeat-containing protein family member 6 n=1 Tax=Crotalus tigris TaxID=88082 RepID=UPI00192F1F6D|nr:maestro heat-like repeat-containing protein family member 6 [Crotalus tigris]
MSGPNGSASGELVEALGLLDPKAPAQEPEVTPGWASPVDVLLSVVSSLKTCETALLDATAVKLAVILQKEKTDLKDKVSEIVEWLYWEISSIPVGRARRAALNVVTSLAEVSPEDVVSSLLKHSLPCNSTASEMWRTLCVVPETNTKVLWHLLRELKRGDTAGYEESLTPLAALRALGEMLKLFSCMGAIQGFYPALLLAILTQIHFLVRLPGYGDDGEEEKKGQMCQAANSSARANSHHPLHGKQVAAEHVRFTVDTLRTLLLRDHDFKALLGLETNKVWGLLSSKEEHLTGVVLFARILAILTTHHFLGLLAEVIPQLDAQVEERALTAKALFAGVSCGIVQGTQCARHNRSKLTTHLIPKKRVLTKLEQWQADPRLVVRWLSFQGLGNLALQKQKLKFLKGLVSRMLEGLNEADEKTVRDILKTLPKVLSYHRLRLYVGSVCLHIAEKLPPFLEDVQWYPKKTPVFLTCTLDYLNSSEAPLRRAAGVFAGFLAFYMDPWQLNQEALIALQRGLDCLLTDPEPSVAQVASISILQVKEIRRRLLPVPSALAWMLCCIKSGEKEKPQFERSPFKRKRSPEAFLSIPQCSP